MYAPDVIADLMQTIFSIVGGFARHDENGNSVWNKVCTMPLTCIEM